MPFQSKRTQLKTPKPSKGALDKILRRSGIRLDASRLEQLWQYHRLLRQRNPELNLTRIHNFENMVMKLYVDSILPGLMMELPSPLMDLGTGPGMPGVPLKIAFPQLQLWLAESRTVRNEFLREVCRRLGLDGVRIIGRGIGPDYDEKVPGVITRAVESMAKTLERVRSCLEQDGLVVFMKGPHCEAELDEALQRFRSRYRLESDRSYKLPHSDHQRRLIVFRHRPMCNPVTGDGAGPGASPTARAIESDQNPRFKAWKKLLGGRGIKKSGLCLVSGGKTVNELLRDFPDRCDAWLTRSDSAPPPPEAPGNLAWYSLAPALFDQLDGFGTGGPLLVVKTPQLAQWHPGDGFAPGCTLLVPFQDPENVGTAIRSAAAFGATDIILLQGSAHPFHPKTIRASGGAVFRCRMKRGPAIAELPRSLPIIALSPKGTDIASVTFPERFGLLAGIEGPGLPPAWRHRAIGIPMAPGLESLNSAVAVAIALYAWSAPMRA